MNAKSSGRAGIYGTLALVMLFWSGNSIMARKIHADIAPSTLAFCRWAGALLVILPFAWRRLIADWRLIQEQWRAILLLGAIGVGSFNTLLYFGLQHTTATNAILIQASVPLFVLILDFAIFKIKPPKQMMLGVILSAIGVTIIVFRADPHALLALSFGTGDALVLVASVAWALYTALLRIRPAIHPLSFLTTTFAVGAGLMFPLAAYEYALSPVRWTTSVLLGTAYIAIFPSVIAYQLYNRAVARIGASATGQMTSLQPLFGSVLAAIILAEGLRGYHLVGMIVILAGIAVAVRGQGSHQHLHLDRLGNRQG